MGFSGFLCRLRINSETDSEKFGIFLIIYWMNTRLQRTYQVKLWYESTCCNILPIQKKNLRF